MIIRIITKKEKAAIELMKESILQIKEYLDDNYPRDKKNYKVNEFSLTLFMAAISSEWIDKTILQLNTIKIYNVL